jgi:hypothetical protein
MVTGLWMSGTFRATDRVRTGGMSYWHAAGSGSHRLSSSSGGLSVPVGLWRLRGMSPAASAVARSSSTSTAGVGVGGDVDVGVAEGFLNGLQVGAGGA